MRQAIGILVALSIAAAPAASAEIFKCVEKNGVERYQNFPCAIDSIGSLPSAKAGKATPVKPPDPAPASVERKSAAPVAVAVTRAVEPRQGMTADEVRALWGEPEQVVQDEPPSGRVEIWEYADGRSVRFNTKQRVLSVQR